MCCGPGPCYPPFQHHGYFGHYHWGHHAGPGMWYHRPWPLGKEEMITKLKEYVADLKTEVEEVEKIIQKLESER